MNQPEQSSGNSGELEALRAERDALEKALGICQATMGVPIECPTCKRSFMPFVDPEPLQGWLAAHDERVKRDVVEQCAKVFCSEIEWHSPGLTKQHFMDLFYRAAGIEPKEGTK